jgi:hypothetical protein
VLFGLVALLLVEAGLHLAGEPPAYDAGRFGEWRFTSNLQARALQGPRDGHAFVVSTNAEGLRTSLPVAHPADRCRIALLGDSTVFGWGVDDGDTVAGAAQAALGAGAEVLNAGQPGYTSALAGVLFTEVVAAYRPDITVLFVPMHDLNRVAVSDREMLRGADTPLAVVRVGLSRHSRIYAALRRHVIPAANEPFLLPTDTKDRSRVPRVSDDERSAVLAELRATSASWGGEVLVGYLPFQQDAERANRPRPTDAWLVANAGPRGPVDLRPSASGQVDFALPDDPGHLSAHGNRIAGEALAAALSDRGIACARDTLVP